MPRPIRLGTLTLAIPTGKTILAAMVMILIIVSCCEEVARSGLVWDMLPSPMVTGHHDIGLKLDLLTRVEREEGPIDCVFTGSSLVHRGIDAQAVAKIITDTTGEPFTCFNFGVIALNITGTARLTQIIINRYHPRLIVYGITFRDAAAGRGFTLNIPWANAQLDNPSLEGWMESEMVSYRYALGYANKNRQLGSIDFSHGKKYGYTPFYNRGDPAVPDNRLERLEGFQVSGQTKSSLEQFLSLQSDETSLLVVEMPVPSTTFDALGDGRKGYDQFIDLISAETQSHDVPLWLTEGTDIVPPNGWSDYMHMNSIGADAFSQWLGEHLAGAIQQGLHLAQTP